MSPFRPLLAPLLSALLSAACAHGSGRTVPVILSVTGLDCVECFDEIATELKKEVGVRDVKFDRTRVEITTLATPGTDPQRLMAAVERAGFHATVGPGHGAYLASAQFPATMDVQFVTRTGEYVPDLGAYVAPGKMTVVDLYAEWCGPCRDLDEHLRKTLAARPDVALRKLNIVDWDSPLAKRFLTNVTELPYVVVYGAAGQRLGEVSGLHTDKLDALLKPMGGSR